ncbi:MAG: DNA-3-methyladenine glycosylase, partial [Solirubrobacterales bacterium]
MSGAVAASRRARGEPLSIEFFDRSVHEVAPALIGCELRVGETAGVIVETEAYDASDPACHAYIGRTARNQVLFGPPGRAYVYHSYGIHSLLNAVAEPEGSAAAVLIRALEPTDGIELMRRRRRRGGLADLCSGPGKLTEALGVALELNGADLTAPPFELRAPASPWA